MSSEQSAVEERRATPTRNRGGADHRQRTVGAVCPPHHRGQERSCDWEGLRRAFEAVNEETDAHLERLRRRTVKLSEKQVTKLGNRHFNLRALRLNNNREWIGTQKLRIAEAQLALLKRRVMVAEDIADDKLGPVVKPLSAEEKARRTKALMEIE